MWVFSPAVQKQKEKNNLVPDFCGGDITCQFYVPFPVFVYLREPHEFVDVLRQKYHVAIWCYHSDEALQRLQVQTVHLSVLLVVTAATAAVATAWLRQKEKDAKQGAFNNIKCWLLLDINGDVCVWILFLMRVSTCICFSFFGYIFFDSGPKLTSAASSCDSDPLPCLITPKTGQAFIIASHSKKIHTFYAFVF